MPENYTKTDLQIDYKKESSNYIPDMNLLDSDQWRIREYIEWLENLVIEYRNENLHIEKMNQEIADSIHDEQACDCGCEHAS